MEKTIGIIGGGVVGLAIKAFYPKAKIFDKFIKLDSWEQTVNQDIIFICVPTPFNFNNNRYDLSAVEETLSKMSNFRNKIVVIKSTVIPGTTERLQRQYPYLKIIHNPEFLDSAKAKEDFARPDKQLVGYTEKSKDVSPMVLEILPKAPYSKILPATAAEIVKYAVNTYYATKVIFGNLIYDICQALEVDYDEVRKAFESDRRIAPGNFDVWHGGYRGFAGKCLPKDLASFIIRCDELGVEAGLLKEVWRINKDLIKGKR